MLVVFIIKFHQFEIQIDLTSSCGQVIIHFVKRVLELESINIIVQNSLAIRIFQIFVFPERKSTSIFYGSQSKCFYKSSIHISGISINIIYGFGNRYILENILEKLILVTSKNIGFLRFSSIDKKDSYFILP